MAGSPVRYKSRRKVAKGREPCGYPPAFATARPPGWAEGAGAGALQFGDFAAPASGIYADMGAGQNYHKDGQQVQRAHTKGTPVWS